MIKPGREAEKIEQLLADPWAIDTKKHKPIKDAENYLFVTMKNMFGYWYSDVSAQRTGQ